MNGTAKVNLHVTDV